MKPHEHLLVSAVLGGGAWAFTGEPLALPTAVGVGVLLDLDHIPEVYRRWVLDRPLKVWFVLHAYEWLPLAVVACWLTGWNPLAIGASLGFLGHLVCDHLANRVHPLAYFFTYRARVGFQGSHLIRGDDTLTMRWFVSLPLVGRVLLSLLLWARRLHGVTRHPLAERVEASRQRP
ncbi:hypothetical protein HRbin23_01027 [bacterium HR23]|nr:hypothetical protein HRbin23_01027 [bacterium HR23]